MSKNDNIEQKFRDEFGPESITNQGWNNPSDTVWDKINTDLSQKEPSKFRYGFFILMTGIILSFLGLGYVINQNNSLHNQIKEVRIELENCSGNNSNPTNIISNSQNTINESQPLSKNQLSIQPINAVDKKSKSNITKKKKLAPKAISNIDESVKNSLPSVRKSEVSTSSKLLNHDSNKNYISSESKKDAAITLSNTKVLLKKIDRSIDINPLLSSLLLQNEVRELESPSINITKPIKLKTPKSLITISGGILSNTLLTNGSQNTAATEFIDQEYAKLGASLELKYTTALSDRWSLSASLGISQETYVTEYNISLPYEISEETIENGAGHIDFEHSLPTSFGNTDTELTLLRSSINQPLDESIVEIDFDTKHQFLILQTPISMAYLFQDISSGFFTGVDLIPSYIISAKSGISSVVSNHSEIESVNNSSTSEYNSLQRLNLALGAHLGYRLPISELSGIELSARCTRNINSHFTADSFTSQSQGIHFSAGYFFKF